MSDQITFLPWLRRGLAGALTNTDPLSGGLPRGAPISTWVSIEGSKAPQTLRLQGPDAVTGIAAAQVLREEPKRDGTGVEPYYFPFVELAAPDLPWMFTPARQDDVKGRLRPWLVLVAVREQDGVALVPGTGGDLPVLNIAEPASELPDLADSWAWAHVESRAGVDGVAAAVTAGTGEVIARLMCPRYVTPNAAWLACVVSAFTVGPDGTELLPAWTDARLATPIELPVYHSWRFTTGAAGTFESLCERLKADGDGAEMGLYPMDVGDPGIVRPAGRRVLLDMEGPLKTLEAEARDWDATHQDDFQDDITGLLNAGARPEATAEDPIVTPPLYGSGPAGVTAVPADGWVRTLNAHPVRRAAAGLGARAVRAAQEALVAAAWDQAGDLRATVTALNRARLGAEIGRSLTRRAERLPEGHLLQFTAPLQAFLRSGGQSVRARIDASDVPGGLVSATYLRHTRPGTMLARDWAARSGATAQLAADHTQISVAATAAGADKTALEFAKAEAPAGAWLEDVTLSDSGATPAIAADRARVNAYTRVLARHGRRPPGKAPVRPSRARTVPVISGGDVSDIADTVREVLDPLASVRANVLVRVPALATLTGAGELPTTVPVGPVFTDPLYRDLLELGSSWVLPGVSALRRNRVRLVETDVNYVGAFLIGANHQLGSELLWRGYPVDLRATFFHRFWDYIDPATTDIDDLSEWLPHQTIRENMGGTAATMTVVVIRGDVVRRFPTLHCYLQEIGEDGEPADVPGHEPDFVGSLDRDTMFVGFAELLPDAVRAGYFVVVEEQPGAPRFGLDKAKPAHFTGKPVNWNALSWGHLVHSQTELDELTHAHSVNDRMAAVGELNKTTWGYNAAHMARACWQRPFRMYIPADELV
jgi:hypothetical protein